MLKNDYGHWFIWKAAVRRSKHKKSVHDNGKSIPIERGGKQSGLEWFGVLGAREECC